jgi:hypothetical protein
MKNIKDELQNIILGDEPTGQANKLKKIQCFLRSDAATSLAAKKHQHDKNKETAILLAFAERENLFYTSVILQSDLSAKVPSKECTGLTGPRH